ncbi:DNA recombination protein RmuC [Pelistega indica]|uniref:DNA recombination protein RmuC n=1 Tax=Pelistega indica TaxID=1414851 RepID=V8G5S7_9BURK|nr:MULTISPECIES: DNA recombination protein RmuC [Pelistega]ETD71343.1 DNA recombination protein RmuC [Pelistega indica]
METIWLQAQGWLSQPESLLVALVFFIVLLFVLYWRVYSLSRIRTELEVLRVQRDDARLEADTTKAIVAEKEIALAELDQIKDDIEKRYERLQTTVEMQYQQLNKQEDELSDIREKNDLLTNANFSLEKEKLALKLEIEQKIASLQLLQTQFEEAKTQLSSEFQNLANRMMEEKSQRFIAQNQTNLQYLLQPFKEQLTHFEKRVNEVHAQSIQGQSVLKTQIDQVMNMGVQMSEDAQKLALALKGNKKVLGNWGETQLALVLERAGLQKNTHYLTQYSFKDEKGEKLIPDVIVLLPEEKQIIIDSKMSLNAYQQAVTEVNPEKVQEHLKQFLKDTKRHVDDLASKDYSALTDKQSLGFVFMFMPLESAYIEVLRQDEALFQYAYAKGVIMVSHTTLLPMLKTIANIWLVANSNQQAIALGDKARDVYQQTVIIAEHLQKLGQSLTSVSKTYNQLVTSFGGQQGLVNKVEKFKVLSTKTSKEMPDVELVPTDYSQEKLQIVPENR